MLRYSIRQLLMFMAFVAVGCVAHVKFVQNLGSRDDGCGRGEPNGRDLAGHLLAEGS